MKPQRLLILTASELTRDPRARRAALAALARDVEVVGVSGRISGAPPAHLDGVDITRVGPTGAPNPGWERARARRERALVRELRGLARLARLAARSVGLARAARDLRPYATVHANDLDTLPAGWLAARAGGARLVYDAHELYSEFDPAPPRVARRLMLALERALARRADAVVTVSEPIAAELELRLRLRARPLVVLNASDPPAANVTPRSDGPLRAVYQGAFGRGRPLDDLLRAVAAAAAVHLTVRVVRTSLDDIRDAAKAHGVAGRVEAADPLPPEQLVDGLRGFDVGVVFDRPVTLNAKLSLPNKLFEYLAAGLAVVVPRLPAMADLVEDAGVGLAYEPGSTEALAAALSELATDSELLERCRRNARAAAAERFNAAAQAETLASAWGL